MTKSIRFFGSAALFVTLLAPAASRAQSPQADKLFKALNVGAGATICEIGAGDGKMSIEAARVVGASGRVLTSELGADHVKSLQEKIAASGLTQISVVTGEATRTNFGDAACDAIFMKDVYHHFAEPAAMNASILAALKPGGRLAIVDFTPPPGSEAKVPADRDNDGMHGITPETLARELKDAGYEPVETQIDGRGFTMIVAKKKQADCS
jgi:ubiquinone/menaquinone biosynthesis C-methylase UbiE